MAKIFGGIDNGVTGSIGIIRPDLSIFVRTPTKFEQNYTKAKGNVTRVDAVKLHDFLSEWIDESERSQTMFLFERPLTGGFGAKALNSAMRSLEATLCVLEVMKIPFEYIDSKEWQGALLPYGTKGEDLKKKSLDIGCRLFPHFKEIICKQKDADGILIAEYCRRKHK